MSPANGFDLFKETVYQSAVTSVFIVCDKVCTELGYLGKKMCYGAETEVNNLFLGLI